MEGVVRRGGGECGVRVCRRCDVHAGCERCEIERDDGLRRRTCRRAARLCAHSSVGVGLSRQSHTASDAHCLSSGSLAFVCQLRSWLK